MAEKTGPADIEALRERHAKLRDRGIRAEAELEAARKELAELEARAREEYGTDDVAELVKLLDAMRRDNEEKRATYEKALDEIEGDLAKVEEEYDEAREVE